MRDGVSLWTALYLASSGALLGCGGNARPSDEAVSAYLDRSGLSARTPDDADTPHTPARRLAITVESGTGLPDLDAGPGVTDPYVILEVEGQRHKTSVVEGSLEPIWGDTFVFDVAPGVILNIKLMDEDAFSSDELIGANSLPLPTLSVGESQTLDITFGQGERGTVRLTLTGMARP